MIWPCSALPAALGWTHSLTFVLVPPPQLLVHWVQSVQSVQTGHVLVLQDSVALLSPEHSSPRVRTHSLSFVLVPPPQDLVQAPQSVHCVQSGHVSGLHVLSSESFPEQRNALLSRRTQSLDRFWFPPPQVVLQSVHFVHSVQIGHSCELHSSSSSETPAQPDTLLGCTHSLTFLLVPPPQLLVQEVHSDQGPNSGQGSGLHSSSSSNCSKQSFLSSL